MNIKYLGHASFLLKGKDGAVVTDPYDAKMLGFKFKKTEADIVTVSHDHKDHNQWKLVGSDPLVINLPGEYEKNSIRITGIPTFHDKKKGEEKGRNTIFKIEIDEVSILHCGDLGHKLSDEHVEQLNGIDILLVPVGGVYTIDSSEAADVVKQVEPSIVIPMHYRTSQHNKEIFGKIASVSEFTKAMDVSGIEPVRNLSVKPTDIKEELAVVVMERG